MKIDLKELEKRSEYINSQKHPTEDLIIWNYSHRCQYDKMWDEYTMMARGLITDLEGNIHSRPFSKFFNYGEDVDLVIPNETPIIKEKYDGSLGILYWAKELPCIATRGSFTSEQAIWATKWLQRQSKEVLESLNKYETMLFEIIYKQNRIVVDYDFEGLIYLAHIDPETGKELLNPYVFGFQSAKIIENKKLDELKALDKKNEEGFVIYYPKADLRLKVKFEDYVRLHRLITGFSTKSIWECLMNGIDIDEILKDIPDEFYEWVKIKQGELETQFAIQWVRVEECFNKAKKLETRKEQAIEIIKASKERSSAVFSLLDGDKKRTEKLIWKSLKPEYELPFKTEI